MKMKILIRLLLLMLLWAAVFPCKAQVATREEARVIAEKWIQFIIDKNGNWNDSSFASVESITDFTSDNQLLGYFCKVNPLGYIIVSYRKELAAVKAYSDHCSINPEDMDGMAGLLKSSMLRVITVIESRLGPIESINPSDIDTLLEINYASVWDFLANYRSGTARDNSSPSTVTDNYQSPGILVTTQWNQNTPYNNDCPYMGCTNDQLPNGNAWVGCVATAGAQVMRYWCWPPYGVGEPYNDQIDWPNMPATVTTSSTPAEQAAVAQLGHEIGIATLMNYECDGSDTPTFYMASVYPDIYRYSLNAEVVFRNVYDPTPWFELIKAQINVNRPVHYRIVGHSIVCDGWWETSPPFQQWYHMNYGWSGSHDAWYLLDALYLGDPGQEYMIVNIYPSVSLSSPLGPGIYPRFSFPYRYFDRDATGSDATFTSGQYLQMLPGTLVTGTGTSTYVKFQGTSTLNSYIYTNGDPTKGIRIAEGAIRMKNNGTLTTK